MSRTLKEAYSLHDLQTKYVMVDILIKVSKMFKQNH